MKNTIITNVNEEKINDTKLSRKNLGKGKVAKTLDNILIGASAIFEALREMPGFEYLKTIGVSNLTTKFNVWLAQTFPTQIPNLDGLTKEEIFKLGAEMNGYQVNTFANSIGIIFSAVLEFIIAHPTVCILGLTTLTGIFIVPFRAVSLKRKAIKAKKKIKQEQIKKV